MAGPAEGRFGLPRLAQRAGAPKQGSRFTSPQGGGCLGSTPAGLPVKLIKVILLLNVLHQEPVGRAAARGHQTEFDPT